jgi:DNA-binding NarL/FixJ family response regulator
MKDIRILLADDHPVVRTGIRTLIERVPDIIVIGEASNGVEALRLAKDLVPDVLLLDIEMPGLTGVEVARQLQAAGVPVRVLAWSAYDDEPYIFALLESGVAGYLTKEEAPEYIIDAVRGVIRGEGGWFSRSVMAKVVQRKKTRMSSPMDTADDLTEREREVLQLVAHGHANGAIAAALRISDGTVKNHVTNIYTKLQVHTRAEAVAWVWQQGLVEGTIH